MFFKQHTHRFFLVCTLLLSSGSLMASESAQPGQDQKLLVLQKWFKDAAGKDYSIDELKTLEEVNLPKMNITELPPEIAGLTNLRKLHLSGNLLKKFPPEIAQLTNLIYLNLEGNQFTELPPEIAQFTNLMRLNLKDNQLTELPPEIGNLKSLKVLSIDAKVTRGLQHLLNLTNKILISLFVGETWYQGKQKIEAYIQSFQGQFTKGAGM